MALSNGRLNEAEQAFRAVIELDPRSVAAHANLGVVYIREKRWDSALKELHNAQRLAPGISGIRLNIGLAYYRQNKFHEGDSGV